MAENTEINRTTEIDNNNKTSSTSRNSNNSGNRNSKPRNNRNNRNQKKDDFEERVIKINRVVKVVKGGRKFRFAALVVVGNGKGQVGFGTGKANEVPEAIRKAIQDARRNIVRVPMIETTIPHNIIGEYGSGSILLKPAPQGTGIIAGGPVRVVLELAGYTDVVSKSLGSNTAINMVRATMNGLESLRTKSDVASLRDIKVEDLG